MCRGVVLDLAHGFNFTKPSIMRLFAITIGNEQAASTRFRLLQYAGRLRAEGVELEWVEKKALGFKHIDHIKRADVVLVQKALLSRAVVWLLRRLAKRIVYDTDDAIWTRPGKAYSTFAHLRLKGRLEAILKCADSVTCANEFLAKHLRKSSRHVQVVPMAVELMPLEKKRTPDGTFTLGWTGAPGNLTFLKVCERPLGEFLKKHSQARLKIMCGERPQLSVPFEHVPWSPEAEGEFLSNLSVGLLPLPQEDEFAKGKSPIKALMYGAHGVPVVGNMAHGGAAEIARHGGCTSVATDAQWLHALEELMKPEVHARMSAQARANIETHHDAGKVFAQVLSVLRA